VITSEFNVLRNYMADGQKVKLDTTCFTSRQQSGIRNGLTQGYWLSAGKIAWLTDAIATEYEVPFVYYRKGSWWSGMYYNQQFIELPGAVEALQALYMYDRMANPAYYDAKQQNNRHHIENIELVLKAPKERRAIQFSAHISKQLGAQVKNVVKDAKPESTLRFRDAWDNNDIWISVTK
jgi:hypothetical protein